ncbi:hypothetical protein [Mycobacterium marinum]|uniref:hypothetical protein n=1 Tax=Mycobacterium marinum TaxID=1781 RepID=UPI0023582F6B|nr:hypothetical protein [Mycobacterium marinum]MDC8973990.1 hypothetical protein [Mycobacterium marinum]
MIEPATTLATLQREALHPLDRKAADNQLLRELINEVIPEYAGVKDVERAVSQLRATDHDAATHTAPWPATASEVTDTWLTGEVERRHTLEAHQERAKILAELIIDSRQQASTLIEEHAEQLMSALDARLQALVAHAEPAVQALDGATTAAQAIKANAAEHWNTVAELRPQYDEIRSVQRNLYQYVLQFDMLPFGDGIPSAHPEARIYYHRNLDDIAPQWRGWTTNGVQHLPEYPWPTDPVERLVWFVRNNSGMWCPGRFQMHNDVPRRYSLAERTAALAAG